MNPQILRSRLKQKQTIFNNNEHSIELLKKKLINRQFPNDSSLPNQNQLVYQLFQLQQKVRNSEKQFVKKELYLQEEILKAQKNFEKTMNLMKFKYQMQIEDLNSELKIKDEEICSLNLQLQQNNLNKLGKRQFSSQEQQRNYIINEYPNSISSRKHGQLKMPTRSQNSSRKESANKYQKELCRIRIQTSEFAQKVESEKSQILSDIAILKSQKQILKSYLNLHSDRTQYNSPIKSINTEINRQNSSSFGVKEYFSRK
ncbi:unnamed protein product (macronuclear) [Paramecium tetraurelia]|uniref:Lebercilin domain-containing protein n=1 Tax=Paramecium tetraurelia TaxID=5888 RepID=A0EGM4_PARTE|nr:uncharacterized protein GSPATT00026789001 [Paramecium tetraurelia]CAK94465.1 unnamed protein product [Paramecium tetraurelia]|eukprot:XP_001461838.1 hypothetical protein (macronuclear) [Paramecium tetraurelia strain d4-2]